MKTNVPLLTKRVGLAATAITGYATAVYFSIQFMAQPKSEDDINGDKTTSSPSSKCTCYTKAPNRTDTFQKIAQVYDDQISRDEFVMGLPLLRRSLLYFHAQGLFLLVCVALLSYLFFLFFFILYWLFVFLLLFFQRICIGSWGWYRA